MSISESVNIDTVIVGHPFAQIGMGTHIRSVFRSLQAARQKPTLFDVYGNGSIVINSFGEGFVPSVVGKIGDGINIFCINGDEVRPILDHIGIKKLKDNGSYNIIYPMWELPIYPEEWSRGLAEFDEIWAPSKFIDESLRSRFGEKVLHYPIACEAKTRIQRSRRHFQINENSFAFITSFDFLSYLERKNPYATLQAFSLARDRLKKHSVSLVLKIQNGTHKPKEYKEFMNAIREFGQDVSIIDETLSTDDTLSLVSLCDAYISLHRSEGFGLGIAEAMCLGRPTICTAWSGNMDFCAEKTNKLVGYKLDPVGPDQYPYWQGQVWASADIEDAAEKMVDLVLNRDTYDAISFEGRIRMSRDFSYLATGLRYLERLQEINHRMVK